MSLATLPVLALFSQPVLAEENIHFSSCKEAWANGYADIYEGEPGYSAKLDRDHDGVACELKNAPRVLLKQNKRLQIKLIQLHQQQVVGLSRTALGIILTEMENPVKNAWQGSYYLKADGKMAQSEWIYDSSYQALVLFEIRWFLCKKCMARSLLP